MSVLDRVVDLCADQLIKFLNRFALRRALNDKIRLQTHSHESTVWPFGDVGTEHVLLLILRHKFPYGMIMIVRMMVSCQECDVRRWPIRTRSRLARELSLCRW